MVIDDFSKPAPLAANGASWRLFTDQVMGGVSRGTMARETVNGRPAVRMRGEVSLENNGGFVQIALDLIPDGGAFDASGFAGIELDVLGNGETYGLHLRTEDVARPWQSYRQRFRAPERWQTVRLPFAGFEAYRIDAPLDLRRLRRIGVVAIGRAFNADLSVGRAAFY
ncbi:MAG: CIA30 family protein [Betaproteobacteria bacterium]|nr:CIA30 family protein [Betaproteobacteria bacterium]